MRVFILFLLTPCLAWMQPGFNGALKLQLSSRMGSLAVRDVLVLGKTQQLLAHQDVLGYTVKYSAGSISLVKCRLSILRELYDRRIITHAELSDRKLQPLNDTMVYRNRLRGVKLWTSPFPRAYNGEGIIMGIIDTGLDFNHPDFRDSTGKTRLISLWEQKGNVNAPSPFNYGREWTGVQINSGQCTHSDLLNYGHGTHVAGVAAGNGLATGHHEGVASKAVIIAVALDFSKSSTVLADAVQYIVTRAQQAGLPFVINASVGDYYGSHDGTDLEAQMITGLMGNVPGRIMVGAAGNAGGLKIHVKTTVSGDTAFTWLSDNSAQVYYGCYGDTLKMQGQQMRVVADRPDLSAAGSSVFRPYKDGLSAMIDDTIRNKYGQRLAILHTAAAVNSAGVCERFFLIERDSSNIRWRIETAGHGTHDAWNFNFYNGALPASAQYPRISYYAAPDSLSSIVSGFQCANDIVSVGNYVNLRAYRDMRDSLVPFSNSPGDLAGSSSIGPTRDGRFKPDIAATGDGVISAIPLDLRPYVMNANPERISKDSMHIRGGGTSVSSPVVAGLAALYLQRHPNATGRQFAQAVRQCAYADHHTGANIPDHRWGFGKLDGKAVMTCGEGVFTPLAAHAGTTVQCVPVPFSEKFDVRFPRHFCGDIFLYAADGSQLETFHAEGTGITIQMRSGYRGLIIGRTEGTDHFTFRTIKH